MPEIEIKKIISPGLTEEESQESNYTVAYTPSRRIDDFHLAGFAYYDGLDLAQHLEVGMQVDLVRELGNPYDLLAVAIYFQGSKIGYVPKDHQGLLPQLLYFGYGDLLEAKISAKDLSEHPERQFRVSLYIKDRR